MRRAAGLVAQPFEDRPGDLDDVLRGEKSVAEREDPRSQTIALGLFVAFQVSQNLYGLHQTKRRGPGNPDVARDLAQAHPLRPLPEAFEDLQTLRERRRMVLLIHDPATEAKNGRSSASSSSGRSSVTAWPARSMSLKRALGMLAATRRFCSGGVTASSAPQATSVGIRIFGVTASRSAFVSIRRAAR